MHRWMELARWLCFANALCFLVSSPGTTASHRATGLVNASQTVTHVRLCYRFALISTIFGPSSTCHSVSLCDTARLQMVSERHILEKDASASSSARHPCRTPWNGAHLQIGNVSEVCLFRLARLGLQLVASPVLADIPQPASAPEALSAEYRSSADTVVTHLRTLRRTMAKEKQIMQASIPSR